MRIRLPLFALVLLLVSTVAAAQTSAIRQVQLTGRAAIDLRTQLRTVTTVILPEGEQVVEISSGDLDFWVIRQVKDVPNKITVKPAKDGGVSNFTIFGASGRVYPFIARESKVVTPDLVLTVDASEDLTQTAAKFVPAARVAELEAALEVEQATRAAALDTSTKALAAAQAQIPATMQFRWSPVPYARPFLVRGVWSDGKFTYLKTDATELPAIYEYKDGQPSLVIPDVPQPGVFRVAKVLDAFYLSLGKQRQQVNVLASN